MAAGWTAQQWQHMGGAEQQPGESAAVVRCQAHCSQVLGVVDPVQCNGHCSPAAAACGKACRLTLHVYVCPLQEDREPMEPVVNTTFPVLLPMLQQLLAAPANSGNQVGLRARTTGKSKR